MKKSQAITSSILPQKSTPASPKPRNARGQGLASIYLSKAAEQLGFFAEQPQILIAAEQPCPSCGCQNQRIAEGSGPHAAKFECADCGRWRKWISRSLLAQIQQQQGAK
jgi:hypothetical protein